MEANLVIDFGYSLALAKPNNSARLRLSFRLALASQTIRGVFDIRNQTDTNNDFVQMSTN